MRKSITDKKKYMADYGKQYKAYKMKIRAKRSAGKPPKYYSTIEDKYLIDRHKSTPLIVEPTGQNFKGTFEPVVCSEFTCSRHLTAEQQLYGRFCPHHQQPKEKPDASKFISYPILKTG